MIYVDLERILVPEDNEKENPYQFYTKKISKTCFLKLWL